MSEGRVYSGWQREKAGFLLGFSGLQAGLVFVAALCGFLPLVTKSWTVLAVTGPVGAVLLVAAFVRVEGRVGGEWVVVAVAHRLNVARRANWFRSTPVSRVMAGDGTFLPADGDDRMELPGVLAPIRMVVSTDAQGNTFAALNHRLDRTYTAVARVTSKGLALVGAEQIDRRVGGWAGWLAQLCQEGGMVARVGAYHTVEMSDGDELRAWNELHTSATANGAAVENLASLFVAGRRKVADHVGYLSVTVDSRRHRREIRNAGGGDVGAMVVLLRQLVTVTGSVRSGGVEVERWLNHDELAGVIRSAFAPHERRAINGVSLRARAQGVADPGLPAALAGPTMAETKWGVYCHDDSWSVTGEVDWPRTPRDASILVGLLSASDKARRHVAVLYEPIAPRDAERALTMDKTKRQAVLGMRAKTGQVAPERERRELAVSTAQDQQLAAGHGLLRFAAYVAVTVTDVTQIEGAWDELCADAGQHGMSVRRCSGWQDAAFACAAVPVGLGLPGKGLKV